MKVKVNKVIDEGSKNTVIFSTEYGNAKGIWKGCLPETDKDYFVEFEIPDTLVWQKDVIASERLEDTIGMENDIFYLIGSLESAEEDGYTVIRLGESIVSLDIEGNSLQVGTFVKVKADNLFLYDMNY